MNREHTEGAATTAVHTDVPSEPEKEQKEKWTKGRKKEQKGEKEYNHNKWTISRFFLLQCLRILSWMYVYADYVLCVSGVVDVR